MAGMGRRSRWRRNPSSRVCVLFAGSMEDPMRCPMEDRDFEAVLFFIVPPPWIRYFVLLSGTVWHFLDTSETPIS